MTGSLAQQQLSSTPLAFASVYVASKLIHAEKLKALRKDFPKIRFTSRWLVTSSISSETTRPAAHWLMDNVDDIISAEFVVVYAEPEDHLRGALVEIGIAWAHGKKIFLAGQHGDYSKWKYLPRITQTVDLPTALTTITRTLDYKD